MLSSNLSNLKDRRRPEDKKNIVYKINCHDCSSVYIGESERNANQPMGKHKTSVNNKEKNAHIYKHKTVTKAVNFNFEQTRLN